MESGFISAVFGAFGAGLFFALTAGAVFVGFAVCLLLSVFKCGYGLKKRLWFFLIILIFCAILKARASVTGESDFSPFLLFLGLVLFLPVYFIRVKSPKVGQTNEKVSPEREYVRNLEDKIKRANLSSGLRYADASSRVDSAPEVITAKPKPQSFVDKPDFSHVKNVLQRLEPALLTYADRRQIHELELSIYEAENGGYSEETRRKINEGLGNLLKIMARHGA